MKSERIACFAVLLALGCAALPERPWRPGDPEPKPTIRVDFSMLPTSAYHERIEGYILTSFYVGGEGEVRNIEILESKPPGVYDATVSNSMKRWKYAPSIVDGERIVHGPIRTHVYFEFEPCDYPKHGDEETIVMCFD